MRVGRVADDIAFTWCLDVAEHIRSGTLGALAGSWVSFEVRSL